MVVLPVSGRQACRVIGQHRGTQRRTAPSDPYRDNLVVRMRELAVANPRRGRRYVWTSCTRYAGRSAPGS